MAGPWESFQPTPKPWEAFQAQAPVVDETTVPAPTLADKQAAAIQEGVDKSWAGLKSAGSDIAPSISGAQPGQWDRFTAPARGLVNLGGMALAPVLEPAKAVIGSAMTHALTLGTPRKVTPEGVKEVSPSEVYQQSKEDVDTALTAIRPRGAPTITGGPGNRTMGWDTAGGVAPPVNPVGQGPLGVTLTEGQASINPATGAVGNLPAIQREQNALRNATAGGYNRAQEFRAQQQAEIEGARDTAARSFDRFGNRVADTPNEAGDLIQRGLQTEARNQRTNVNQAYTDARAAGGELDVRTFNGMGTDIRQGLFQGANPVVVDAQTTPIANAALRDVDNAVNSLRQSTGTAGNPTGISLDGVDQIRQRLNSFRRQAQPGSPDERAMRRIVDEFDTRIDAAVNSPAFMGNAQAVDAWNSARDANTRYRQLFGREGATDPVGKKIQEILGNPARGRDAAIPEKVVDFIYGASGSKPSSLNVATARRVRDILGDASPEWSGVKQGLFARLTETPVGATDFGPGRAANQISEFLTGRGQSLANFVFSPAERTIIRQYADLQRQLAVPQAGAQWSNNNVLHRIFNLLSQGVGAVVGGVIGSVASPTVGTAIGGAVGAGAVGAVREIRDARQIARQMPLIVEATQRFNRTLAAYNRANTPPTSAALQVATNNLVRSLKNIGVDLSHAEEPNGDQQGNGPSARPK